MAPTPSGEYVYLEDEVGVGGTGHVHVLDTHGCDGVHACAPRQAGFWHINGHPVQAAAVNGRGSGSYHGVIQRFFSWDAHNLDVKGENTLVVANYTIGIRLLDTSDKTNPVGTAFYLPTRTRTSPATRPASSRAARTWGAYFGSDGDIYASDFWLGFFIVKLS
jgi:hypothetical protein